MTIYLEKAIRKRLCHYCGKPINKGQRCITFWSAYGTHTTRNNPCLRCMKRLVREEVKK